MKITWFAIAILGLLMLSPSVFAQTAGDYAYLCNDCTPAQTLADAQYGGDGDYFIYDFVQSKLTHYSVTGSDTNVVGAPNNNAPNVNQPRKVTLIANTAASLSVFSNAQTLYNQNGGSASVYGSASVNIASPALTTAISMGPHPLVDPNGRANAFDMVQSPSWQPTLINSAIGNIAWPATVRTDIATILNVFFNNGLIKTPIQCFVTITFPDGSTSIIQFNTTTQAWTYVANSSKDAYGNPIPETSVEAAGGLNSARNYTFPGNANGNFVGNQQIHNMNALGISVDVVNYNDIWVLACTNSAGQTHCVTILE